MRWQRIVTVGVFVVLCAASRAQAATITFDNAVVNANNTFSVDVRVVNAVDLFTFSFDVAFDPSVVSVVDVTEGSFLRDAVVDPNTGGTSFFPGLVSNGVITLIANSLFGQPAGANGSGVLAALQFMAIGTGNAGLAIQNALFFDSADPANTSEPGIENGRVTVIPSTVPEPATLALFGLGLIGAARRFV